MKKKALAILLSLAMVFSLFPVSAFASGTTSDFSDMPSDWSTKALENAVNNGLLVGDNGKIMPNDNLTRAQMAAVVNRAFGTTEKVSLSSYTDVAANAWYYDDMAKAVQMKTFVGSGDKLNPAANITREEAFAVLTRAFKLSGADQSALDKFSDKTLVSSWAKDAAASLISAGYIAGSNSQLNPKHNITRAEFAQIMDNLLKNYIKTAGTYTTDYTGNVMINVPGVTLKDIKITGDIIIGDGVGNGDVTLDGITVTGRTIIRGGGVNSIKIIGNSNLQNIIIARVDGQVRVYAEDGTQIGEVIVDGSDNVTIEGNFGAVTVTAPDITVTATNADIVDATIVGDRSIIMIGDKSTITTATIEGDNAKIITLAGSKIDDIVVNSDGATISGAGEVGTVEANADNTTVTTPGTSVTAATGTTGVTAGTITVTAGTTEIVGGGSSGGGGGGGGSHDIAVRAITSADVAVTTGSVIFGYTFTAIGGTVTYADAKDAPYYLNVDASTVTLTDGSNTSSAVSVNDLEIADDGTVKYTDLVDIQSKFAGLDFVPTEVLIHLVGASSVNSGSDAWTKDVTVTLDAGEVALLAVVTAEGTNSQAYVNVAQGLVTALPEGAAKTALQDRIDAVQAIIDDAALLGAAEDAVAALEAAIDTEDLTVEGNLTAAEALVTPAQEAVAAAVGITGIDAISGRLTTAEGTVTDARTAFDATAAELANASITTAIGLVPATESVVEGTDTNLLTMLNAITGMSATGVTLTLDVTGNANVATNGEITYTGSQEVGDVIVKINKTDGTEQTVTVAVTVPAAAPLTEGDWTYTVADGNATIIEYTGTDTVITIPSTLDGNPVTIIGGNAFLNNKTLTSVAIPANVTSIGDNAFTGCTELISVTMQSSNTTIGNNLMDNSNNNYFKTAYTGGAGIYTGTWNGAWTRLSSDATITGGALEGVALTGNFTGGAIIGASTELTVTVFGGEANDIFGLTKGNANSVVRYVVGSDTPVADTAYTLIYGTTTIDTTATPTIIWLLVTAEDTTTKLYYKITATAASSDATLSLSSTVKGVTPSSLGTPAATQVDAILGLVTITAEQAANVSNTGGFITLFVPTDAGASLTRVVKYAHAAPVTNFATDAIYANEAITNLDFFAIQITAANGSVLHYCIEIVVEAAAPLSIGDSYGGGKVAYILQSGDPGYSDAVQHGLIAATNDQNSGIAWALTGYQTSASGATGTAIGTGLANTAAIVAQNGTGTNYAAGICDAWVNTNTGTGVYSDWYLPSKDELMLLYQNLGSTPEMRTANGFASAFYRSSTENSSSLAWNQYFDSGYQDANGKSLAGYVRAVRAF